MAIQALRPGFVNLCIDTSLNNVNDDVCRIVIEGAMYDNGNGNAATPNTLVRVTNIDDAQDQFGEGSLLATGLEVILTSCGSSGVQVLAIPRNDPAGGVATEYALTFTGPATSAGRVQIYWGEGRYTTDTFVPNGSTALEIATLVLGDFNAMHADEPYPFSAALDAVNNAVVLTARNAGEWSSQMPIAVNWTGRNNIMPTGVTVVGAFNTNGTGTQPTYNDYEDLLGDCCVCAYTQVGTEQTSALWAEGLRRHIADQWSCERPQCFGHGYVVNRGTLGEVLAQDTNSAELSRVPVPSSNLGLGGFDFMAIADYAAVSVCRTLDNPELNIQGPSNGQLSGVQFLESCAAPWTYDERVQLVDAGFAVTIPGSLGFGGLASPYVTVDITNNRTAADGTPNGTFVAVSSRRLAVVTTTELAELLNEFIGLGYYTENTDIREGVFGTNRLIMLGRVRTWAQGQVGRLFSQFDNLNADITLEDDFDVAARCQGVPGRTRLSITYRPPLRPNDVITTLRPRVLDNCN